MFFGYFIAFELWFRLPTNAVSGVAESAVIDFRNETDIDIKNAFLIVQSTSPARVEQDGSLELPLPVIKSGERAIFVINENNLSISTRYFVVAIVYQEKRYNVIYEWEFSSMGVFTIFGENEEFAVEIFNRHFYRHNDSVFGHERPYDRRYEWDGEAFVQAIK